MTERQRVLPPTRSTSRPRFYFDSQDGSFFRDEDGTDCSDLSEAKGVAARFVRELAYDAPPKMPFEVSVIVRDERGENIAVASAKFEMRDQSPASLKSTEPLPHAEQ